MGVSLSGVASEGPAQVEVPDGTPGSCVVGAARFDYGIGIVAKGGTGLTLDRFRITGSALAGLALAGEATVEGRAGVVTGNGIGINLMTSEGAGPALADDVFVFGNGQDVTRRQMELPDLQAGIGLPTPLPGDGG